MTATQVEIVRLDARGRFPYERPRLCSQEPELQSPGDRARQLVLDRKDVLQFAVIRLGPEMVTVPYTDQLGHDPQRVAVAAYTPLENSADAELLADLADADILSFEGECRSARGNMEPFDVGQRVDDLLSDAIGEIFVARLPAHIYERQYGNRGRRGPRNGGLRRRAVAQEEIPYQPWGGRECADTDEHKGKPYSTQTGLSRPCSLDPTRLHVKDPRQRHDNGEAHSERNDHVAQHVLGPAESVHHRLDDLKHGKGGDTVPNQCAEHAPALQLPEQRRGVHEAHPGLEPSTSADGRVRLTQLVEVDTDRKADTVSTMADEKKHRRVKLSFTDDFKAGAVRLVLDEGKT